MPTAGTPFRFARDIVLTSANNSLRVVRGGSTSTVVLTPGTYRWLEHSGDSRDLMAHLVNKLATTAGGTWAGTIGTDGLLYLDCSVAWSILVDALTTIDRRVFGLNAVTPAAFGSSVAPYTAVSPYQLGHIWQPGVRFLDHTGKRTRNILSRSRDLADPPGTDTWLWGTETDFEIYVPAITGGYIWTDDATTETPLDEFRQALAGGSSFEFTPNIAAPSTHQDCVIADERWLEEWPVTPMRPYPQHHETRIPMRLVA